MSSEEVLSASIRAQEQGKIGAVSTGSRIAGLDGLRACAVCIVLVAHFGFYQWVPGGFGVTLFFFISGVLITRLLMAEYKKSGTINIHHFYIRRFLRLYPALLVSVIASIFLYPIFNGHIPAQDVWAVLFYYANFYGQEVGFMRDAAPTHGTFQTFGILWSLAVEEQYYLIFPLFMIFLIKDMRKAAYFFVLIIVVCLAWRMILHHLGYGYRIYSATDTRIDSILFGALLAACLSMDRGGRLVNLLSHSIMFATACTGIAFSMLYRDDWFRDTLRYSVQGLCLMPIVTAICFSGRYQALLKILESRIMIWLGALSYSLYVFHGHALVIGENIFKVVYTDPVLTQPIGFFLLTLPLTFAFAMMSYYWVERPFFSLRVRFGSHVSH